MQTYEVCTPSSTHISDSWGEWSELCLSVLWPLWGGQLCSVLLFCFSMSHKQWIQQLHTEVPGTWIQKKYFLLCKLCFSLMFVPVKRKESTVVLPSTLYDISIFAFLKPLEIAIKICLQMIQYLHISILVCLYVCNYILISINVGREREENWHDVEQTD